MAKKRQFSKVRIYAQHAPERFNTDNPGWRQQAKEYGNQIDENDLLYEVCDGGRQTPDIIDLEIRRGVSRAVILSTLRKMVDLIDRHPEYLDENFASFVTGHLTVNGDGTLRPVVPDDDEAEQGDESPDHLL